MLTLPIYISKHSTAMYFHILISVFLYSIHWFCIWWFFVINLCWNVLYLTFDFSKPLIVFENKYPLSFRFHCVDIFYTKFRYCETLTAINPVARTLLTDKLYKFRTNKCWSTLYLHMYVLVSVNSDVFIYHLASLSFLFH